ncbi:MAG: tRNA lysidine(34) synthetase TilS [Spirochaetia bacterium]|nr:tRNA lysidine(34) synthetase TilS [Spirochaetia bacterium]
MLFSKTHLTKDEINPVINKNWILAFSAGADSMLCLHLLLNIHKAHPVENRQLMIYFLDHGDQQTDQKDKRNQLIQEALEKVKTSCPDLHVKFLSRFRNIKKIARRSGKNFELIASKIRYKHLKILFSRHPDSLVITGHNLSDWYETLLMRINRGAELNSLFPFSVFENQRGLDFFRPLILMTGQEVRHLCGSQKINYWDDPTNFNDSNLRSKLRNYSVALNADGLRITAKNLLARKNDTLSKKNISLNKLKHKIQSISQNREYRIKLEDYETFSTDEKDLIREFIFQDINFWPLSGHLRLTANSIPFHYRMFHIETENWYGDSWIVFRRGRNTLRKLNLQGASSATVCADQITKKYYIQMPYGKKSVKKILSESRLSLRQRCNLPLPLRGQNSFEVIRIPLSLIGLKDIISQQTRS